MPEQDKPQITIREAIADSLGQLGGRTRSQVIEHFAGIEASKQATALIKGLDRFQELDRELSKIRPQNKSFDAAGNPLDEPSFTKEQIDQRKKLTDQIDKLERAINKADDNNDFGDLYNLVNKGGNNNKPAGDTEAE